MFKICLKFNECTFSYKTLNNRRLKERVHKKMIDYKRTFLLANKQRLKQKNMRKYKENAIVYNMSSIETF